MQHKPARNRSPWWPVVIALAAVSIPAVLVTALWLIAPLAADDPGARVNAVQASFTIAFGAGGLATLGLFARRQWLQERVHDHDRQVAGHAQLDADERRITEQYVKAVEQLGHDKAPVRLAGLYALDRLGRDHPEQRQVIADVWCAYLRQRYSPPADLMVEFDSDDDTVLEDPELPVDIDENRYDEFEVRMTAQRLLASHLVDLRPGNEREVLLPPETGQYWHLDQLDLTGATLIDVDFRDCVLPRVQAVGARFYKKTNFVRALFHDEVDFSRAHFHDAVWFVNAVLVAEAQFKATQFHGPAFFLYTYFGRPTDFEKSRFFERSVFSEARFDDDLNFFRTDFRADTEFKGAHFQGRAIFADLRMVKGWKANLADASVSRLEHEEGEHQWPPGWVTKAQGDLWVLVRQEPAAVDLAPEPHGVDQGRS